MTNHTTFATKTQSPDMQRAHTCIICGSTESAPNMVTGPFIDGAFAFLCEKHLRHPQLLIGSLADYIAGKKLRISATTRREVARNA